VLVPSFGAVCEIEDALGANLFTLGRRLALAEITAREVIDLAHACLAHARLAQTGVKLDKAALGEAILEAGTLEVMAVLAEFCANYAFGGRREKKDPGAGAAPTPATPDPDPARSSAPA
ncbi:MAG: GTA-gp10 family protein, partial [Kiloniellales bacterium]